MDEPYCPFPDLPPVPEAMLAIWRKREVEQRAPVPLQRAFIRYLTGDSQRTAAEREGLGADNFEHRLKFYGLHMITSERLIERIRQGAEKAWDLLLYRMETKPDGFTNKDLVIMGGVATDKIRDYESWRSAKPLTEGGTTAFDRMAEAVASGKITLRLEVSPGPETLDVGPIEEPHASPLPAAALPVGVTAADRHEVPAADGDDGLDGDDAAAPRPRILHAPDQ